jgi:hypothetical protein
MKRGEEVRESKEGGSGDEREGGGCEGVVRERYEDVMGGEREIGGCDGGGERDRRM